MYAYSVYRLSEISIAYARRTLQAKKSDKSPSLLKKLNEKSQPIHPVGFPLFP